MIRAQPTRPAALVPGVPHEFERIILHCLRKDRDRRCQHIADVKVALEDVREESASAAAVAVTRPRHRRLAATLGGLAVVTAIAAVWMLRASGAADPPAPRVVPLTTLTGIERDPTFSPDGEQMAFRWNGETQDNADIYVKMIGSPEVRRLTTAPGVDSWPAWPRTAGRSHTCARTRHSLPMSA